MDDYYKKEEKGIGLIISPITYFYAFKEPNTFSPWSYSHYKLLENTISQILFELYAKHVLMKLKGIQQK